MKELFQRYLQGKEDQIKDKNVLDDYYAKIREIEKIPVPAITAGGMEEEIKRVIELMTYWVMKIKANNCLDFYDINRVAEDLALRLLNAIYDLRLTNLNDEKRKYPGIDLGDKENKIAFQVTSRIDAPKIQEDLKTFVKGDKKTYSNGIRFLILNETKPKLTPQKWREIDADFNPKEHIITPEDLIKEIRKLYNGNDTERARFYRIKEILEVEVAVKGLKNGKKEVKPKQIKILAITASPGEENDIYYEKKQDLLLDSVKAFDREEVFLDLPDPDKSTLTVIQEHLDNGWYDILYIAAHGGSDENGEGILALEDTWGEPRAVTAQELVKVLVPAPRIVILSSCYPAGPGPGLKPVAQALFREGIGAVIAMKTAISPKAALDFNGEFFTALNQNQTLDAAFEQGKTAIKKGEEKRLREDPNRPARFEYEIPCLLVREEAAKLTRDDFSPQCIGAPGRPQSHHFLGARFLERGFIGRRRVLRAIYKALEQQAGAVILKGPGGIGKSTLTTRVAANLRMKKGYEFIVVRGATSTAQILEAISKKTAGLGVKGAEDVYASEMGVEEKLVWYLDHFLTNRKVAIIFDNFEENQDEEKGDFRSESLKKFLWFSRDALRHKDSFLLFSTRYRLPGFEDPGITLEVPEFTPGEFRKMLLKSDALKRLDKNSVSLLQQEIGGNPRALELLDRIAVNEFGKLDFSWEQLKDLIPELRERIIDKKDENDDFTPLFLEKLLKYLDPGQRLILEVLSVYRKPVPQEALEIQGVKMERRDRQRLAGLSLLESLEMEKGHLYYVHRLTAGYLLERMEIVVKNRCHVQAARYFKEIRDAKGKLFLGYGIEARWHFLQAGEWNRAAEITFALESFLTLHGYPQWSMELLQELDPEKLNEMNRLVVYGRIGTLYQDFGEYDKSLDFQQKAYEIAQKNNDLKNSATGLHLIGNIYYLKGNYGAALIQYEKAKETFEKIGDIKGLSGSLHQIGRICQDKGDYDAALNQYQKALKISEEIGDKKNVADILLQIGILYQDKGDFDVALIQYEKAKEIFEEIKDIRGEANSLHQIGIIYHDKRDYDAALNRYQKSLEIRKKIWDIRGISASLHNIGMIYQDKGDIDAALAQYRQALEIEEKIGDIAGEAKTMGMMGTLYFQKQEFEAALKYFFPAYLVFSKLGSPSARQVKEDIDLCRDKLPEVQFKNLLKEFNLEDMEHLENLEAG